MRFETFIEEHQHLVVTALLVAMTMVTVSSGNEPVGKFFLPTFCFSVWAFLNVQARRSAVA